MRYPITLFFLTILAVSLEINPYLDKKLEDNVTEAYFISSQGLGQTQQVQRALQKIKGQIEISNTTYNTSGISYQIENMSVGVAYDQLNQKSTVQKYDSVRISGGRFNFTYKFSFIKFNGLKSTRGNAYGSVVSDPITYEKEFSFTKQGYLALILKSNTLAKIETNRLTIQKMNPYNLTDFEALQNMLDSTNSEIQPSSIKHQLLLSFNSLFFSALNTTVNPDILVDSVDYSWQSKSHGNMTMRVLNLLYQFGINPQKGFSVIILNKIQGWEGKQPKPTTSVPNTPADFQKYGGIQSYRTNELHEQVVLYLHSKGWLDSVLDRDWEVDSFKFYAGNLFDLIDGLSLNFYPTTALDGKCEAQKEGIKFSATKKFKNTYALIISYQCSLKGINIQGTQEQIIKFTAKTNLYILAGAATTSLTFKIAKAEFDGIHFEQVGRYAINNVELATDTARQVLKKVENSYTFGTNYPTLYRKNPRTRVDKDMIFYYENVREDHQTQ